MLVVEEFQRWVGFKVGDGRRVRFWQDVWCGNGSLVDRFHSLFELAQDKFAAVADYMERDGVGGQIFWNIRLRRQLKDEELGSFLVLVGKLYGLKGLGVGGDELCWLGSSCGKFSVKSFYQMLCGVRVSLVPWRSIWFPGLPPKVSFFVWIAALNRILTIDNLNRRGWVLVNRCCMCGSAEETVDHLLVHCSIASQLWSLIFALFGVTWVQSGSVSSVLWSWSGSHVGRSRRKAWFFAPHCLMWLIWLERNRRTFQDVSVSVTRLKSSFLSILLSWVCGRVEPDITFFLDFVDGLGG